MTGQGGIASEAATIPPARLEAKRRCSVYPYVTLKAGITLDGKLATRSRASRWITGEEGRVFAHQLRATRQGVLVGIGTVLADDPQLTVRLPDSSACPARVVLDSQARIPVQARCLAPDGARRYVITGAGAAPERIDRLRELGVVVHRCGTERPAAEAFLSFLRKEGLESLLVEGGGAVHASMIAQGVADEIFLIVAGKIVGDDGLGWCAAMGLERLADAPPIRLLPPRQVGDDVVLHGLF